MFDCQIYHFGPYENNVYVLRDQKIALVIDAASGSFNGLKESLKGYKIHLFLTHGHWDHMCEAVQFQRSLQATIYAHREDKDWFATTEQSHWTPPGVSFEPVHPDVWVEAEQVFNFGGMTVQILHTPGHTPGQIALYISQLSSVFVGDTLFHKTVGRTDLPKGNFGQLENSIQTILYHLPDETRVYPGHGKITTIGFEKQYNQVIRARPSKELENNRNL